MRLGFIGAGAMSNAIAKGIRTGGDDKSEILLFDVHARSSQELASAVHGTVADSIADVIEGADIVLLAVKPQVQTRVLQEIGDVISTGHCPALLSIAAGRSLHDIGVDLTESGADPLPPLIRVMPNVNAQIGSSMSAITFAAEVPEATRTWAKTIFESVGVCLELPESLFDVFSALAACSPAWFFQIVDTFARAGVKHGLTKEQALITVTQAMLGSALLLQSARGEGDNPGNLIDRVCSPGGTTIAGLLAAQEAGLDTALVKAVDAAVQRDHELGN